MGEEKVRMEFGLFGIGFNMKKMCGKVIKEGKGVIRVGKYMFMGVFIRGYNWNIGSCWEMDEEKVG